MFTPDEFKELEYSIKCIEVCIEIDNHAFRHRNIEHGYSIKVTLFEQNINRLIKQGILVIPKMIKKDFTDALNDFLESAHNYESYCVSCHSFYEFKKIFYRMVHDWVDLKLLLNLCTARDEQGIQRVRTERNRQKKIEKNK